MHRVVLLSEIHPHSQHMFENSDILVQAKQWFSLIDERDIANWRNDGVDFVDAVDLLAKRASEREDNLVIRDWSHLDFTGVPFNDKPAHRSILADLLNPRFTLHRFTTVRHPIDQWLSLEKLAVINGKLGIEQFLSGYRRFAEMATNTGFVRFEDFCEDPDTALTTICEALAVPFDPSYRERWHAYRTITGDVDGTRGSAAIKPLKRRDHAPEILGTFRLNSDYQLAVDLLGYAP